MNAQSSTRRLQAGTLFLTWYRHIPLRYHIVGHSLLSVVLLLGVIWAILSFFVHENSQQSGRERLEQSATIVVNTVRQGTVLALRTRLQGLADAHLAILGQLNQEVLAGNLGSGVARERARQSLPLLMQRIDEDGTCQLTLSDEEGAQGGNTQRPADLAPGLHILSLPPESGGKAPATEAALPRPDNTRVHAVFNTYFVPWNWRLSLSVSLDSAALLSQESKDLLASFPLGAGGSLGIINTKGEVIYHPWLRGNVEQIQVPAIRSAYERIIALKTGEFFSAWREPNETEAGDKIVLFRFIPELEWILVSTAQKKELFAPTMDLGRIIFLAVLAVLALVVPLSLYLANTIARPLARLADQMDAPDATDSDMQARASEQGLGEIGLLEQHFNRYREKLFQTKESLTQEINELKVLKQQLAVYHKAFENTLEGACITDPKGNVLAINPAFVEVTGYTEEEVLGRNMSLMKSGRHDKEMYADMWQTLQTTGRWKGEIWNKRKNGEIYPEILNIGAIYDNQGNITHFVGVFHDITEMKYQEERIAHQAYHDPLTGLPNRVLAIDRIGVSIAHVKRGGTKLAVLFLDLDNFKNVNDTLGHEAGDKLLIEVAARLKAQVREEDTVARLGGDEFLVLVAAIFSEDMVIQVAQRILRVFSTPFFISGKELFVTVSVGIAFYPQDGDSPALLIKYADIAMYQAKSRGKNNYHLFTADLSARMVAFQQSETALRRALVAKEFEVYYQPKFDLRSNQICGAEALVRWKKQDGSVAGPIEFISLAEQTGLILPLGEQIFNNTCLFIHRLRKEGYGNLIVSVNLSPLQFSNATLVEGILNTLKKHHIPGSCLQLELTESTMLNNPEKAIYSLNQLVKAGITIALDDFGTGYSSLAYLKKLPISTLKIDNSFIRDLPGDFDSCQLVSTIIMMAHNLDITMIAEGVETQEQMDWLRENHCEQAQGYFFSKPLSLEPFFIYLEEQRSKA